MDLYKEQGFLLSTRIPALYLCPVGENIFRSPTEQGQVWGLWRVLGGVHRAIAGG